MITIHCSVCGTGYSVEDEVAGTDVQCTCGEVFKAVKKVASQRSVRPVPTPILAPPEAEPIIVDPKNLQPANKRYPRLFNYLGLAEGVAAISFALLIIMLGLVAFSQFANEQIVAGIAVCLLALPFYLGYITTLAPNPA